MKRLLHIVGPVATTLLVLGRASVRTVEAYRSDTAAARLLEDRAARLCADRVGESNVPVRPVAGSSALASLRGSSERSAS
jgi:hypothetical protein